MLLNAVCWFYREELRWCPFNGAFFLKTDLPLEGEAVGRNGKCEEQWDCVNNHCEKGEVEMRSYDKCFNEAFATHPLDLSSIAFSWVLAQRKYTY